MAKPTMLQSLLGRPSQTYSFPEEKAYYSTKRDMLRIAAETSKQQAAVLVNDDQLRVATDKEPSEKQPHGVRAFENVQLPNNDRGVNHAGNNDGSDTEDLDYDVFYTPNTSPRLSMASTVLAPLKASSPQPSPQLTVPSTKTSFTHPNTSTTSISSSALDAHSIFSFSNSESTLMTSPVQSDSEYLATRVKTVQEPPQVANGHVDQEWAKEVRWLVPTTAKATTTPKRRHSAQGECALKSQTRSKPNTPMSKTISKMTPSIMTSMTALLEDDELLDSPTLHHPSSSVLISTPRRSGRSRMFSNPNPAPTSLKKSPSTRKTLHRRRSRSLEHAFSSYASSSSHHTSTSVSTSSHTPSPLRNSKYASSSADPYDRSITSLPIFTAGDLPSHGTPGYTSLVLPRAPVPLSQTSQRPKGIFNLKDTHHGADIDGKVDLTRSGVAQTTIASVEVVRGLSGASSSPYSTPSKKFIGLFRRSSTSASPSPSPPSAFGTRNRSQEEDKKGKRPETCPEALDLPLGFTSYRKPPAYVPSGSVLVQVWAVGIDGVDWRLVFGGSSSGAGSPSRSNTFGAATEPRMTETLPTTPKRSVSLKSTLGRLGGSGTQRSALSSPAVTPPSTPSASSYTPAAVVGYIPGRSFVGRVLECGWEVEEEVVKKGDWVIGLLDLRKCGALTEFIVVDRHRVHRAPYPRMQQDGLSSLSKATLNVPASQSSSSRMTPDTIPGPSNSKSSPLQTTTLSQSNGRSVQTPKGFNNAWACPLPASLHMVLPLSLEELALLPGCGIPAYRAIRTFVFAFSDATTEVESMNKTRVARDAFDGTRRRRALVLRGHDGAGAMGVQMLVRRGWRVCVHVPFGCLDHEEDGLLDGDEDMDGREKYRMRRVEERVRAWGGEEVIFDDGEEGDERGAVVRVLDRLREDGDMFDAVLDTIGGKEVWEAGERLLKVVNIDGAPAADASGKKDKAKRKGIGVKQFTTLVGDIPGRTIPTAGDTFKASLRSLNFGRTDGKKLEGKVGYTWVSYAQDVDWEGEDIRDTLREVLRIVTETDIRPWVGEGGQWTERTSRDRVIPFEKVHELFVSSDKGVLMNGGSFVVKVVG
ncbi:hypothetical protein C0995_009737 [Termitomyces sp. Mi166|nr:hypothetical protein C0995_009737 [Termitomyces sp. Mi166\